MIREMRSRHWECESLTRPSPRSLGPATLESTLGPHPAHPIRVRAKTSVPTCSHPSQHEPTSTHLLAQLHVPGDGVRTASPPSLQADGGLTLLDARRRVAIGHTVWPCWILKTTSRAPLTLLLFTIFVSTDRTMRRLGLPVSSKNVFEGLGELAPLRS